MCITSPFLFIGGITNPINWYRAYFRTTVPVNNNGNFQKIKVPTLLVFGDPDIYLDTEMAYMCEEVVENLTVEIVKDSNHFVIQDKPVECNKCVREFLKPHRTSLT